MKGTGIYLFRGGISILMVLLIFLPGIAQQNAQPEVLKVRFLKDSVLMEENTFSFNNVNLTNNSSALLHIQLSIITPESAELITTSVTNSEIRSGENQVFPFRFTPTKTSALTWRPFSIEIRILETGQIIKRSFWVRPIETTKWKASLKQPTVTFMESAKEVPFEIYLENSGNGDDIYTLNFKTTLALSISKNNYTISLPAGSHQIITAKVLLSPKDIQHLNKEEIEITIDNKMKDVKMLIQSIVKMGHLFNGTSTPWFKMPLTVELNLQNLWSNQPFAFVNVRGSLPLNNHGQFNILYQSDNIYKDYSSNTHLATAQYINGPWKLTGGSILDFNNFLIDGVGANIQYTRKNNGYYEAMAVKSRFGNTRQFNFKTAQPINKKMIFSSNSFINQDAIKKTDSYLTLNKVEWNISKNTKLAIEGGAGMDKLSKVKLDTSLTGFQTGYHFETFGPHYQLTSAISLFSKNFPGINKGFEYQLHEARWLASHFFTGPYMEINKRAYNNAQDSVVNFLFNINTREYGFRFGIQKKKFSMTFSPGLLTQIQDSVNNIKANMYKISVNTTWQVSDKWWFSLFSNAGQIKITGSALPYKPLFSFNNFISFQSSRYGLTFRYDEGPYYYYEIKQYLLNPTSYQRIQLAPFLEFPLPKWNIFYRLQFNYSKEKPSNSNFMVLYNNLQYTSSKMGMDIALTAQLNVKSTENPYINFTIRKRLQLPVLRNKKSKNFTLVLFLDANNNNKLDAGESIVPNAKLSANNELLLTNNKGAVEFHNTNLEAFAMDYSQISNLQGWIPKMGYRQVLNPGNEKMFFVPFTRSRIITGNLALIRDEKSGLTMPLDGIRMIAVGSQGETYNTLTDADGAFFFNLNADNYTISINQSVFDENFKPSETSTSIDLINNDKLNIQFEIRQRKRQINIRKE